MKHLAGIFLVGMAVAGAAGSASAESFSVVNSCSYTVYPGIYPPVYQNGGWACPGSSVVITVPSNFNGRVWGRTGCDGSNLAHCATGQWRHWPNARARRGRRERPSPSSTSMPPAPTGAT